MASVIIVDKTIQDMLSAGRHSHSPVLVQDVLHSAILYKLADPRNRKYICLAASCPSSCPLFLERR
jgi:hypothetical protein